MSAVSLPGSLIGSTVADQSLSTNWNVPAACFRAAGLKRSTCDWMNRGASGWSAGISWTSIFEGCSEWEGRVSSPGVDMYNVFNTNPVLTENQEFGSSLGTPMRILQGRLMRLTAQINF